MRININVRRCGIGLLLIAVSIAAVSLALSGPAAAEQLDGVEKWNRTIHENDTHSGAVYYDDKDGILYSGNHGAPAYNGYLVEYDIDNDEVVYREKLVDRDIIDIKADGDTLYVAYRDGVIGYDTVNREVLFTSNSGQPEDMEIENGNVYTSTTTGIHVLDGANGSEIASASNDYPREHVATADSDGNIYVPNQTTNADGDKVGYNLTVMDSSGNKINEINMTSKLVDAGFEFPPSEAPYALSFHEGVIYGSGYDTWALNPDTNELEWATEGTGGRYIVHDGGRVATSKYGNSVLDATNGSELYSGSAPDNYTDSGDEGGIALYDNTIINPTESGVVATQLYEPVTVNEVYTLNPTDTEPGEIAIESPDAISPSDVELTNSAGETINTSSELSGTPDDITAFEIPADVIGGGQPGDTDDIDVAVNGNLVETVTLTIEDPATVTGVYTFNATETADAEIQVETDQEITADKVSLYDSAGNPIPSTEVSGTDSLTTAFKISPSEIGDGSVGATESIDVVVNGNLAETVTLGIDETTVDPIMNTYSENATGDPLNSLGYVDVELDTTTGYNSSDLDLQIDGSPVDYETVDTGSDSFFTANIPAGEIGDGSVGSTQTFDVVVDGSVEDSVTLSVEDPQVTAVGSTTADELSNASEINVTFETAAIDGGAAAIEFGPESVEYGMDLRYNGSAVAGKAINTTTADDPLTINYADANATAFSQLDRISGSTERTIYVDDAVSKVVIDGTVTYNGTDDGGSDEDTDDTILIGGTEDSDPGPAELIGLISIFSLGVIAYRNL